MVPPVVKIFIITSRFKLGFVLILANLLMILLPFWKRLFIAACPILVMVVMLLIEKNFAESIVLRN
ncbi:hypothetical protein D2U88_17675 [Flagellimonas aequoris]|uniref:Uncharacterized protein n=1 Tax=Flagellimonas aequoris TaxID=2306997 RepID=A0A418N510_9FLAO|nr:hypothetical protein D2U88_17675 [Allomuricauda aequoris]